MVVFMYVTIWSLTVYCNDIVRSLVNSFSIHVYHRHGYKIVKKPSYREETRDATAIPDVSVVRFDLMCHLPSACYR